MHQMILGNAALFEETLWLSHASAANAVCDWLLLSFSIYVCSDEEEKWLYPVLEVEKRSAGTHPPIRLPTPFLIIYLFILNK